VVDITTGGYVSGLQRLAVEPSQGALKVGYLKRRFLAIPMQYPYNVAAVTPQITLRLISVVED
jgi:hypothetical protein